MSLPSYGKNDITKTCNESHKPRVPKKKVGTYVGKSNKHNKLFKKRLMGRKNPILHTIPEVSFIESTTPPKQNTFVVADRTGVLDEAESSADLKHRKAVALAKVNARHVVDSWNNYFSLNSSRSSSGSSLSPSPPLPPPSSIKSFKSSLLSSSSQRQRTRQDSNMQRQNQNVRQNITPKDEGVKSERGEQIYFDWDSSTAVSYHQQNKHIPSAINKLYQVKHRKRLQAKKKPIDGVGSKSAPTSENIQKRSGSSSGRRRRKIVTSSKEKLSTLSTKSGKTSRENKPQPPKEAFVTEQKSISIPSANIVSNRLVHVSPDGHTDSDKENNIHISQTTNTNIIQHSTDPSKNHKSDKDNIEENPLNSTKSVSFAGTYPQSSTSTTSSFSQGMGQTYLDIHRHIKKYNVETHSSFLPSIIDAPTTPSTPTATTTTTTTRISTHVKQKSPQSNNVQIRSKGDNGNKSKSKNTESNKDNHITNQILAPTTETSISTSSKFSAKSRTDNHNHQDNYTEDDNVLNQVFQHPSPDSNNSLTNGVLPNTSQSPQLPPLAEEQKQQKALSQLQQKQPQPPPLTPQQQHYQNQLHHHHHQPQQQQHPITSPFKTKNKAKDKNNNKKKDILLSQNTSCNSMTTSSVQDLKPINTKESKTTPCENHSKSMTNSNTIIVNDSETKETQNLQIVLDKILITRDTPTSTTSTITTTSTTSTDTNTTTITFNSKSARTIDTNKEITAHKVTTTQFTNTTTITTITPITFTPTTNTTTTTISTVKKSIQPEKDERKPALPDHQATPDKPQGCNNQLDSSLSKPHHLHTKRPIYKPNTQLNTTTQEFQHNIVKPDYKKSKKNNAPASFNTTSTCTSGFPTSISTTTAVTSSVIAATSTIAANNNPIITPLSAINNTVYNTNDIDEIDDTDDGSNISPRLVNQNQTTNVDLVDHAGNRVKTYDKDDRVNIEMLRDSNGEKESDLEIITGENRTISKKQVEESELFGNNILKNKLDSNIGDENEANVDGRPNNDKHIKGRAINEGKGGKPVFVVGCLDNENNKEKSKEEKRHANRPLEKEGREAEVLGLLNSQSIRDRVVRIDKCKDGDSGGTTGSVGDACRDNDESLPRDSWNKEELSKIQTGSVENHIAASGDGRLSTFPGYNHQYHNNKGNSNTKSDGTLSILHCVSHGNGEYIDDERINEDVLNKTLQTNFGFQTSDLFKSGSDCDLHFKEETWQNDMDHRFLSSENNFNKLNATFNDRKGNISVEMIDSERVIERNEKINLGRGDVISNLESSKMTVKKSDPCGQNSEVEFYKDFISNGGVIPNDLDSSQRNETVSMLRQQTIENLSLESNFKNAPQNGVKLSVKDNSNGIYTKPVMVRPKTAGKSHYSKDEIFNDTSKGESGYSNDDGGQSFTSAYLLNNSYIHDQWWTNNNYVNEDEDIKFINTEDDYYEVFGYDDETRKILEATKVYPIKNIKQHQTKSKSKASSTGPTISSDLSHTLKRSTKKNVKLEHEKIRTISDSNSRSDNHKKIVPKLDLNLSPERNPETSQEKSKAKREGKVNLSNEERESKSKQDISDIIARCGSDDSIYRNQQNLKFPQGKLTHISHFSNKTTVVKKDSTALTPRITHSYSSSSSSFNNVTSNLISPLSKLPTVKPTTTLKSINSNYNNSEINLQILESKKNKNVERSRKQSYKTEEGDTTAGLNLKNNTKIFGDIYQDPRVVAVPSSKLANQHSIPYKSFTKARRRIRSEADINSLTSQDKNELESHGKSGLNKKSLGVDCASTFTEKNVFKYTEGNAGVAIHSYLKPILDTNISSHSNVNNQYEKYEVKKNVQQKELKQRNKIEEKQSALSGVDQSVFVKRDDDKKHVRNASLGSQPEIYDVNVKKAKSKFSVKVTSDDDDDDDENVMKNGNTRLSQSFNGRENKDIHSIPLSLSLPKQSRLLKDEHQISKPGHLRSNNKTVLAPLITGKEKETSKITQSQTTGPMLLGKPRKLKPIIHHSSAQKQRQGLASGL